MAKLIKTIAFLLLILPSVASATDAEIKQLVLTIGSVCSKSKAPTFTHCVNVSATVRKIFIEQFGDSSKVIAAADVISDACYKLCMNPSRFDQFVRDVLENK